MQLCLAQRESPLRSHLARTYQTVKVCHGFQVQLSLRSWCFLLCCGPCSETLLRSMQGSGQCFAHLYQEFAEALSTVLLHASKATHSRVHTSQDNCMQLVEICDALSSRQGDGATGMQAQPSLFDAYHEGFRAQVATWQCNPVDLAIAWLRRKPKVQTVADFGCGDAQLARELHSTHRVLSFDLVAANEHVTACTLGSVPCDTGVPRLRRSAAAAATLTHHSCALRITRCCASVCLALAHHALTLARVHCNPGIKSRSLALIPNCAHALLALLAAL